MLQTHHRQPHTQQAKLTHTLQLSDTQSYSHMLALDSASCHSRLRERFIVIVQFLAQ